MNLSALSFLCAFTLTSSLSIAAPMSAQEASKRIQQAVQTFKPLAKSGVSKFKVEPQKSVRSMLMELALQQGYIFDESEFIWVDDAGDAWDTDTSNWAETTMKDAYSYVTGLSADEEYTLNEPGNEKQKATYLRNRKKAKSGFKLLLGTGVRFGVAPMGAMQCGVTLAALAILDPRTGKIYLFAREDSGC